MKKLLLLSLSLIGVNSFAQGLTCETATSINTGTFTSPQITGTYIGSCLPAGDNPSPKAIWYTYTPTANGEVTISTDLPQNDGVTKSNDTRLSVLIGTCATLACYDSNDDVNPASVPPNYLSKLTFPVEAGTTYTILWDSGWSDMTFDFTVAFNGSVCIRPGQNEVNDPTNITTTSAQLSWKAAIGNPTKYDVEYGATGFTQGTGTVKTTAAGSTSIDLTNLPDGANLEYYYRSNCGLSKSAWVGPYSLYLAKTLPYANNFDNTSDAYDGFMPFGWSLTNTAGAAQSGTICAYTNSSTTAATNTALVTRAIALQANEQVTLTFYTKLFSATGSAQTLKVGVVAGTEVVQLGADISVSGTTYTLQTRTFTATTAGTYNFIFNNTTPIVATATAMLLDTVNFTSVLGTNDFLTSKFSVYPNPVNNVINFSNDVNAIVSTIEMTDLNGRVIKSLEVNAAEGQVSVSDLATGIYMMRITTDQGIAVKKIIKE